MRTLIIILSYGLLSYSAPTALAQDRNWLSGISYCGCQDCNKAAYNANADGFTCGERILNLIFESGMTEEEACSQVAGVEHSSECAPCDPSRCDGRDAPPPIPVSQVVKPTAPALCECESCTQEIWGRLVGFPAYTCGARIEYLQKAHGLTSKAACIKVATEFVEGCGKCNSGTCAAQEQLEVYTPTDFLPIAETQPPITRCGCSQCTPASLNSNANGHSCGERINFLLKNFPNNYPREEDACRQVAHVEFPNQCGQCDPTRCNDVSNASIGHSFGTASENNNAGAAANNNAIVPVANNVAPASAAGVRDVARDMDLYCFPPKNSRQSYDNVWGKYTIQPKTDVGGGACGPGDNIFSDDAVSLENNGRDLKLQYKKVGNAWHGSEVRVLLPREEMPFHYGSYMWSIKSIRVLDTQTGSLVSTVLPSSLVLGLFTWDPTEDYSIHENYNHEVDVEISRWGFPNNPDAQFLVQPPGDPQMHRFFSGSDGRSLQQAPRVYGFSWSPTNVEWFSNAGQGGQRSFYSTQDAINAGQPDYNQCMPANAEVRINLWNAFGSSSNPYEMEDNHVVEVVIDSFQFVPSGKAHVEDGEVCSKDCHCSTTSRCIQNKCTSVRQKGGKRRRLSSEPQQVVGQNSFLTAPVVLLLMAVNAILAVVVIRRRSSANAGNSWDSYAESFIQDRKISGEHA